MHLLQSPSLLAAAREEATLTIEIHPTTGVRTINLAKLLSMPLLQAIFAETLRLHVAVTLSREIHQPVVFEGYTLPRGSYIQAFTGISHVEEETWGIPGHPATEFWPARHLVTTTTTTTETRDEDGQTCERTEFSLKGRGGTYFPFGRFPSPILSLQSPVLLYIPIYMDFVNCSQAGSMLTFGNGTQRRRNRRLSWPLFRKTRNPRHHRRDSRTLRD